MSTYVGNMVLVYDHSSQETPVFRDKRPSQVTRSPWHYVYDTTAGIPAVIEENDGDPVYYVREPNGALIARVDGETTNYYHFDELGSTRFLTNGSETVTDTYTYDAWGKQTAHTGQTPQPITSTSGRSQSRSDR